MASTHDYNLMAALFTVVIYQQQDQRRGQAHYSLCQYGSTV